MESVGNDINGRHQTLPIRFSDYTDLHYCCFVILTDPVIDNPDDEDNASDSVLVFEGNIDGEVKKFLAYMINKNGSWLRKVYCCCEEFDNPSKNNNFLKYLLRHDVGANAFYVAWPGMSVKQIRADARLREKIEGFLDNNWFDLSQCDARHVFEVTKRFVCNELTRVNRPLLVRYGCYIFFALLLTVIIFFANSVLGQLGNILQAASIFLLFIGIYWAIRLRWLECTDIQTEIDRRNNHVSTLIQREQRQQQTHLTSVTTIKEGWLREWTLRSVLFVTAALARMIETKGRLSGIVTIHFARWVIIDGVQKQGKRLLFLSNYDGSWENYLGEFVDHASQGLTGIWSNTTLGKNRGFPNTRWLICGGSRDEQRFKSFARNSQHIEQIWYSAYKDVSVQNIGNNITVRDLLSRGEEPDERLIRRFQERK